MTKRHCPNNDSSSSKANSALNIAPDYFTNLFQMSMVFKTTQNIPITNVGLSGAQNIQD
jgi:hypothetical protein